VVRITRELLEKQKDVNEKIKKAGGGRTKKPEDER
jgi:hypothetical protein